MFAVFKKEYLGNFRTTIGWIFLAVETFFLGWYFRYYGLGEGMPYLSYIVNASLFIFLFSVPILTMRSFSEEKRMRTDQLLFTVPVSMGKIVIGKYLAAVAVFLPIAPLLLIFMLLLNVFGKVPFTENLLTVLCFTAFGLACIAIGIFISAISDSQITAAILTFFVLLLGTLMPQITSMISSDQNRLTKLLSVFSLTEPFDYSLYGILYLPSYLYYGSIIVIMLILTTFYLQKRHLRLATKGALEIIFQFVITGLALYAVIAANIFLHLKPESEKAIDLTYNKIHSLTEAGKSCLDRLETDVNIYVLADETEADETIRSTLTYMEDYSDHIIVNYVSTESNPYFYMSYSDTELAGNSIIVEAADKFRVIDYFDCYQVTYDYSYNMASGNYEASDYHVTGYDGEGRIIAAVNYVATGRLPLIGCVSGHDEFELPDTLKERIENAGYRIITINLLNYDDISEDVDVLFILGPFSDFNQEDADKVRRFYERGGRGVFVLAFSDSADPTVYYELLGDFGIHVLPGVISEGDSAYYNSNPEYLLPEIVRSDITENVYTDLRTKYVYLPFSKALQISEVPGVRCETFLSTTEQSSIRSSGVSGPFSVAIYAERYLPEAVNKIAVFGSDYFLYDEINRSVNGSNYDLFIHTLKKISENDNMIEIPVKSYSYDPLMVSQAAKSILSVLFVALIPSVMLFIGGYIWYNRRRQ